MKNFPSIIPVFPLSGVIYFPKTNLPLNIFEQRYLNLVNDAFKKDKLMGMVQSKKEDNSVYEIGCLGKISDYQKSEDGRILINLTGVSRFKILKEISNDKLYREFEVDYKSFVEDLGTETSVRYRGVVSGDGKMAAISIVKFESKEDADDYVRSFNASSGWGARKTNRCNSIPFQHVGVNIGNGNHKGRKL